MKRFLFVTLGGLFVALSIGLLNSLSVNAASAWDNVIQVTDELTIERFNNGDQLYYEDITLNYVAFLEEHCDPFLVDTFKDTAVTGQSPQVIYQDVIPSGRYAGSTFVGIYWSGLPDVYWETLNGQALAYVRSTFGFELGTDLSGNPTCNSLVYPEGQYSYTYIGYDYSDTLSLYLNSYDPNYPPDYEGEDIPDTVTPGFVSDWAPDIKLHHGNNWIVELSDYNFFTFDRPAFTCGQDELVPIIDWEVWDISGDEPLLITTLTFSASAVVTYEAPKIQEDKKYLINAKYWGCDDRSFNTTSSKEFTVRKDGSLRPIDFMVVCIMDEFPYINFQGCIDEFNDFLVTLSFRTPPADRFGGGAFKQLTSGCRELQVLDAWILSPGQTVCPQFSEQIRTIVTPFVTFTLGLIAATFISKRGYSGGPE